MIQVLKSKIHKAIVTQSDINYDGSITIDEDIMDAANLVPYERVEVNNPNGHRDVTYVIPGKRGSNIIGINGALSSNHKVGDIIHILSYEIINSRKAIPTII